MESESESQRYFRKQNGKEGELSRIGYQFVPDNVLPAYAEDGSIDHSKSVLVTHAVDSDGNIIDGRRLLSKLDESTLAAEIRNHFKISKTESGDQAGQHEKDKSDEKIFFTLIGIIAVIAVTFVVTLAVLIHNIHRFKRKLKAATLEVHGIDPMKHDTFPGLNNESIKAANPIFMRDDLVLDESKFVDDYDHVNRDDGDTLSNLSGNSLDQNTINSANARERVKSTLDEQEVTLDMYGNDEAEPRISNVYEHLNFRHSEFLQQHGDFPSQDNRRVSNDVGSDGDLEEALDLNISQFESTDI